MSTCSYVLVLLLIVSHILLTRKTTNLKNDAVLSDVSLPLLFSHQIFFKEKKKKQINHQNPFLPPLLHPLPCYEMHTHLILLLPIHTQSLNVTQQEYDDDATFDGLNVCLWNYKRREKRRCECHLRQGDVCNSQLTMDHLQLKRLQDMKDERRETNYT